MVRRVLIADDDAGMRLVLSKIIERIEGFEVAAEAEDGEEALRLVSSLRPHVVFVDVEMPLISGVELAKRIAGIDENIIMVFATAHEEYMPEAFSVYAFDYLLKPFRIERVEQTLKRIKSIGINGGSEKLHEIVRHEKGLDKLLIRGREGVSLVDMDAIILIQREERSSVVYTSKDRYATSENLGEIEEKLDKMVFFRSHKSYIVNLSMVSKIQPYGRWTYIIKFKGTDKDALLTSEKYEVLENAFKMNI